MPRRYKVGQGGVCQEGANLRIELRGGDGNKFGNVFVTNKAGCWGPVCEDSWDEYDANVTCKQLGYYQGFPSIGSAFGKIPHTASMKQVQCDGTEDKLQDWQSTRIWLDNCSKSSGAGVFCVTKDEDENSVYLLGGDGASTGNIYTFNKEVLSEHSG